MVEGACEWFHEAFTQDYVSLKCFYDVFFAKPHLKSHKKPSAGGNRTERLTSIITFGDYFRGYEGPK